MLNKNKNKNKVFTGEDAIFSYLTPGSMGCTPLVELPSNLNPFIKDKVRIFVKLAQSVPLSNIKSLPSFTMLSAIPKKDILNIQNLVEYSSGNTVLSLTILSKYFGIPNMHAIITPDVPEHKKRLLRLVGANLLISNGPPSPGVFDDTGGIYDAKILGQKKNWHNLNQYVNQDNPVASLEYIGKEIWQQLGDKVSIFTASIGTAGTIVGASKYLKNKIPKLFILGASIKKGFSIPGPRGELAINKLGIEWKGIVDKVLAIPTKPAFLKSLEMIRLGLFVGPSTGMQLSALLDTLKEHKKKGTLKNLRNKDGEIVCTIIACDTMFPYIDDYFDNLSPKLFSEIKQL
jgi:cysteine synthase